MNNSTVPTPQLPTGLTQEEEEMSIQILLGVICLVEAVIAVILAWKNHKAQLPSKMVDEREITL